MPHDMPLISLLAAGIGLAFVLGAVANRLRLPPLVGYLVAGIAVGPYTPGFVANQALAAELAELGVILLMFGVGLHFSLKDLLSVRAIAIPGALVQIAVATALGAGVGAAMGWSMGAGIVFGLALSVASTVVLLRALQERRLTSTERGKIAVGWLIVEDMAMVLALVLLPALAGLSTGEAVATGQDPVSAYFDVDLGLGGVLAMTIAKVVLFVVLMLVVGRRLVPWILHLTAHTGSRELFRLSVLAIALVIAFGAAELFGVSFALGAFFAGMILSESDLSSQAAQETLPLRDAFSVLFFVAVGMLFNPMSLLEDPLPIAATLFIILIGKSLAAFIIVLVFRHPVATALTIAASLAQIGEFSFILAELGVRLGVLPIQARDLILAGALMSIILNPAAFWAVERMRPWLEKRRAFAREPVEPEQPAPEKTAAERTPPPPEPEAEPTPAELTPTELTGHVVLVGYGRVGSRVGQALRDAGRALLVVEDADKPVESLREAGTEVIVGNAATGAVLAACNLSEATHLIVAIPDAFEAGQVVEQARNANPGLVILAQAYTDAEVDHLTGLGANAVITGQREIARGILEGVLPPDDGASA